MKIKEILSTTYHRPWDLPTHRWKFYQEWNKAIFLHWKVSAVKLKRFIPDELQLDLYKDQAWVSLVAFAMEKIRPRNLPAIFPISTFNEINIRTYVKYNNKPGVYFLSIEGGNRISCQVAKRLSDLPYRHSNILKKESYIYSNNTQLKEEFKLNFRIGTPRTEKSPLDSWLMERYALYQDTNSSLNEFEIHHVEWPIAPLYIEDISIKYSRFKELLNDSPTLSHYSSGVKVVAWDKVKNKRLKSSIE